MKVSIGNIVHFVLPDGRHRPGIVVRVWEDGKVNMVVFVDGSNDQPGIPIGQSGQLVQWATSVRYSDVPIPWTWHCPEDYEDKYYNEDYEDEKE